MLAARHRIKKQDLDFEGGETVGRCFVFGICGEFFFVPSIVYKENMFVISVSLFTLIFLTIIVGFL